MLDKHDSHLDRLGQHWMVGVSVLAVAAILLLSWLFPERDATHGLSVWHVLGELEARFWKACIALAILFFIASVMFGPKSIQEKMSPSVDELGDIMELNKEVYRRAHEQALEDGDFGHVKDMLPYLNIAGLSAAIQCAGRFLGWCLLLSSLLRLT